MVRLKVKLTASSRPTKIWSVRFQVICGSELTIIFVLGENAASSWAISIVHSEASQVCVAPFSGGCNGTYLTVPPGISISAMYLPLSAVLSHTPVYAHWSKYGSKTITSSPGSTKAMKALNSPSLAPEVMTISVSGLSFFPK